MGSKKTDKNKMKIHLFLLLCTWPSTFGTITPNSSHLRQWIVHNSGYVRNGVDVCNVHHSRGLCSSLPLKKDDVIATIPQEVLITTSSATTFSRTAFTLSRKWETNLLPSPIMVQRMLIAVFLLEQIQSNNTSYSPYVDSLPSSLAHLPIFWSQKKLKSALQTSHLTDVLTNVHSLIEQGYSDGICPVVPSFCVHFTMQDYMWAIGIVRSRGFETEQGSVVMVPFGDMLNHNASPTVSWALRQGTVVLRSTSVLPAGTELSIFYGTLDAAKLLSTYGFSHNISRWKSTVLVPEDDEHGTPAAAFQLTTEIDTQAIKLIHFVCAQGLPATTIQDAMQKLNTLVKEHMREMESFSRSFSLAPRIQFDPELLYHARQYRAGELHVLDYWKNLTDTSRGSEKKRFHVGSTKYLMHGLYFRLVRIVRIVGKGKKEEEMFDVVFTSGTKILNVKRDDLLDEATYVHFLCSLQN